MCNRSFRDDVVFILSVTVIVPRVLSFPLSLTSLWHKEASTEERVIESNHPGDDPKVFFFVICLWLVFACNKLQLITSETTLEPLGQFFNGYDSNVDASTRNAYACAAATLRMGHSLIRDSFGQFSQIISRCRGTQLGKYKCGFIAS